ncbi:MAG: site-specific integrase [Bacteroidales bacterium]|nr:site-specific integrase [Bacteroidales bacterium]
MATTKIILKTEKAKTNGEIPIYLRIIKDRKAKFISLGISIDPKYWNDKDKVVRKSHSNSVYLNNYLAKKISDAQSVSLEMETNSKYVTPKKIKQAITGKTTEQFIPYAERYYENIEKKGRIGSHHRAKAVVSKLKEFVGKSDFTFDDLNVYFLKKYEDYLRDELKNATNTIHTDMKVIRRIINEAINDDIFPIEKNPFLKYKLKWTNTEKAFLTENELKALADLPLNPGSMKYHHRNIYVFAAYSGGMRISDICKLRWENFDGERILLSTTKTGSVVSIKLPNKALEIIELYRQPDQQTSHFIFPFLDNEVDYSEPKVLYRAISGITAYTNKDLKALATDAGISKNLHFHTSRHTWATRALRKGMRIEYVSKLMGHASIKTTQVYAKIVNEELDKAMDVFN